MNIFFVGESDHEFSETNFGGLSFADGHCKVQMKTKIPLIDQSNTSCKEFSECEWSFRIFGMFLQIQVPSKKSSNYEFIMYHCILRKYVLKKYEKY